MRSTLAPSLLLAAPRLGDPNFDRTVVLLGRHESEGALGWVLNGQALPPVCELLGASGLVPEGQTLPDTEAFRRPARIGGPVSTQTGWLIFRSELEHAFPLIDVRGRVKATGDTRALEAVMRGEEPTDFRLVIGHAGWGPGQLEAELKQGSWLPAEIDEKLLFDTSPEQLWDATYESATGATPGAFSARAWASA